MTKIRTTPVLVYPKQDSIPQDGGFVFTVKSPALNFPVYEVNVRFILVSYFRVGSYF